MYARSDTEARFLAVRYPFGGDFDTMVGPELVKTWDYIHFDLAYQSRAYFALPNGYEVLAEYPVGLTASQALQRFVRDFRPAPVETLYRTAGWIRPNGAFYATANGHYTLAQYLTTKIWGGPAGEEFLEEQGWCRIHYTGQITPPNGTYRLVTVDQIETAKKLRQICDDEGWREALTTFIITALRARRVFAQQSQPSDEQERLRAA